jgi:hypothetical protein
MFGLGTFLDDPSSAASTARTKVRHLLRTSLAGRRRMPVGALLRACVAIARISCRFRS